MIGILVALVVVLVVGAAVWFAKVSKHPEQTASHHDESVDTTSERLYSDVDRPAGPDVELDPMSPAGDRDPVDPPPG